MTSKISAIDLLGQEFCQAFGSVFEQAADDFYPLEVTKPKKPAKLGKALEYALEFSGTIQGTAHMKIEQSSAAILAAKLMGEPAEGVVYAAEHEDAVFEILSQTVGLLDGALRTRFGTVKVTVKRSQSAPAPSAVALLLKSSGATPAVSVLLLAEQALVDSISARLSGGAAAAASQPQPESPAERQNLRLIMDVELNLTLRFGQRTLTLSEIADLATGSVIELDRLVDDPVDLLLGDRVIARGEVVIADGNYGLRITEIAAIDRNALLSA